MSATTDDPIMRAAKALAARTKSLLPIYAIDSQSEPFEVADILRRELGVHQPDPTLPAALRAAERIVSSNPFEICAVARIIEQELGKCDLCERAEKRIRMRQIECSCWGTPIECNGCKTDKRWLADYAKQEGQA